MASEIGVQTIQHTNGTDAMTIDSSGRVLKPQVPAFMLSLTSGQALTASNSWTTVSNMVDSDTNCFTQGGMSLSSGVITVPVAGVYHFSADIRVDGIGSSYFWVMIAKNDSTTVGVNHNFLNGSPDVNYDTFSMSGAYQMSANDTVRVKVYSGSDTSYTVQSHSHFSGFLVG